ncbi:hypothetical protein J4462_04890 [Candidatus Pacearchaeota archaeon]|nr:hypothetical protein [Candidatus Pacearchaeota archaeon]
MRKKKNMKIFDNLVRSLPKTSNGSFLKKTNTIKRKICIALIKKKNLVKLLKERGIRTNPDVLFMLMGRITEHTCNLLNEIREKLTIKGKKTLQKKDLLEILEKQTERNYPEI